MPCPAGLRLADPGRRRAARGPSACTERLEGLRRGSDASSELYFRTPRPINSMANQNPSVLSPLPEWLARPSGGRIGAAPERVACGADIDALQLRGRDATALAAGAASRRPGRRRELRQRQRLPKRHPHGMLWTTPASRINPQLLSRGRAPSDHGTQGLTRPSNMPRLRARARARRARSRPRCRPRAARSAAQGAAGP